MRTRARSVFYGTFLACSSIVLLLLHYRGCCNKYFLTHEQLGSVTVPPLPLTIPLNSYIENPLFTDLNHQVINALPLTEKLDSGQCRMSTCFNYSKCRYGFKVYVYPDSQNNTVSESYSKILNAVRASSFFTTEASEACLFIPNIDTLDRDSLSVDYVRSLQEQLHQLPYWQNGENHIIFNLYSGTWPDYSERLDIDLGHALIAKASISTFHFRSGFDISLPLFHKTLPERGGELGKLHHINYPSTRKYTLAFKGKRYLTGIGSESRNSLYHIHNGKDIIMLTTCRHGKGWEKYADDRCPIDNELYDQYDYKELLANSTFCLVPRGRRLGSFRFLEVLQYGCIPVLLSDNWELPFSEVIDWTQAAIQVPENLIFELPFIVRSMPDVKIGQLQQQSQFLWENYFSSIEKITVSSLRIVRDRVESHNALTISAWNTHPGATSLLTSYSKDLQQFPSLQSNMTLCHFTALLFVTEASHNLRLMLKAVTAARSIAKIYVFAIGNTDTLYNFVQAYTKAVTDVPIQAMLISRWVDGLNFYKEFPTDAVLMLNQHDNILTEEIDFIFSTWKEFPSRLVGSIPRLHLWHNGQKQHHYSSKKTNRYSMVLPDLAILHRYYLSQYFTITNGWREQDSVEQCYDILLNFIVSHLTKQPPIKVGPRFSFSEDSHFDPQELQLRDKCMDTFVQKFGYLPLQTSAVRLDPALFKDAVAVQRKRYAKIESVT